MAEEGRTDKKKTRELICICCPVGCRLTVLSDGEDMEIQGNRCKRGKEYAVNELLHPMRSLTTTVRVKGGADKRVPVRTKQEIPKEKIMECMAVLKKTEVAAPVKRGDIVVKNIAGTGADIIAAKDISTSSFHVMDKML
ncbi:DUF1667 domain-containing protein [Faecalicatena acetigenes]|uniref:DUF1667 domain-containing protein n=1 Tax=Faecalicatena acetigenes TaxID=2981790 RepID=A0ABT2TDU6_9FIRM|nr:DUF1667 domain-containing protein [Faecalicatena acetigenes]MCU6748460.1 DUF1667 domain-containing protein [Faecalicatena acetigenes]SCI45275.1 Uncharacterized protein with conserved CXXC pairs [uncultured Clostridium sp.]